MPQDITTTESSTPSMQASSIKTHKKQIFPYLLIGVVILIVVLIIVIVHHGSSFGTNSTVNVSITANQFSPVTVQVKPGTEVTWTNKDSVIHRVAADPYPSDNSIPGFDSNLTLQPHDSYSFTFESKGTYAYHDEQNPLLLKGKVVVK